MSHFPRRERGLHPHTPHITHWRASDLLEQNCVSHIHSCCSVPEWVWVAASCYQHWTKQGFVQKEAWDAMRNNGGWWAARNDKRPLQTPSTNLRVPQCLRQPPAADFQAAATPVAVCEDGSLWHEGQTFVHSMIALRASLSQNRNQHRTQVTGGRGQVELHGALRVRKDAEQEVWPVVEGGEALGRRSGQDKAHYPRPPTRAGTQVRWAVSEAPLSGATSKWVPKNSTIKTGNLWMQYFF